MANIYIKYPINVKKVMECVYSHENLKRLDCDYNRYEMYNGQIKEHIRDAISKEFLLPETVKSMIHRIVPINLIKKITNKLAKVYLTNPIRVCISEDEQDQENLDFYTQVLAFNTVMKTANRYVELFKHTLIEPFLYRGIPWARALPSHQYTPYNDDPLVKCVPTVIAKHISMKGANKREHVHHLWSDEQFIICDGEGTVIPQPDNPENLNIYGVMPFTYINTSQENVIPLSDDDLIAMQFCICLLLTDLNFASKYQSWSIIYVVGKLGKNISFNPNSVVELSPPQDSDAAASIGTIDPKVKSDELLRLIESLIGLLLTTKSLSVGTVSTSLDPAAAASGVAKILDQAEVIDEQEDQKAALHAAEQDFWDKFANKVLPVWLEQDINPLYYRAFSDDFGVDVIYPSREVYKSEDQIVDTEVKKLNAKLTTRQMSLKKLYPNLDDEQIQKLDAKILEEAHDNGGESENGNQPPETRQNSNTGNEGAEGDYSDSEA